MPKLFGSPAVPSAQTYAHRLRFGRGTAPTIAAVRTTAPVSVLTDVTPPLLPPGLSICDPLGVRAIVLNPYVSSVTATCPLVDATIALICPVHLSVTKEPPVPSCATVHGFSTT